METVKAWFGFKSQDSDLQVHGTESVTNRDNSPSSERETGQKKSSLYPSKDNASKMLMLPKSPAPGDNKSVASLINEKIEAVTPPTAASDAGLEPTSQKSCVPCKVIGVTAVTGAMLYVMYQGRSSRHMYTGWKKVAFVGQCFFLSAGLGFLAASVVLGSGPFQTGKQNESISFMDQLNQDCDDLKSQLSRLTSSAGSSK